MTYSIFDTGNLVVSFEREDEAQDALRRIAHHDPRAADDLLLVAFDDTGRVVSECVVGELTVSHP
jgi:hypothetical protein